MSPSLDVADVTRKFSEATERREMIVHEQLTAMERCVCEHDPLILHPHRDTQLCTPSDTPSHTPLCTHLTHPCAHTLTHTLVHTPSHTPLCTHLHTHTLTHPLTHTPSRTPSHTHLHIPSHRDEHKALQQRFTSLNVSGHLWKDLAVMREGVEIETTAMARRRLLMNYDW